MPVEIQLVMPASILVEGTDLPGRIVGHGPVPASLARRLVRAADQAWVRRIYQHPDTGELVATDSRRRTFGGRLRHLVVVRDDVCRTPWCDAPIKHVDHPRRAAKGGMTSLANSQGLCERCNYTKESPGWSTTVRGPTVTTTTPTGHLHLSRPPGLVDGAAPKPASIRGARLDLEWAA